MRDAESIFDKVIAYTSDAISRDTVAEVLGLTQGELLERATSLIAEEDVSGLFGLVDQLVGEGKDLPQFLHDLVLYGRDLLRLELGAQPPPGMEAQPEKAERARELAGKLGRERLQHLIGTFTHAQQELRRGAQEILTVELALATAAQAPPEPVVVVAPPAEAAAAPESEERAAPSGPQTAAPTSTSAPRTARPRRPRPAAAPPPVKGELTLEIVQERWENMLPEQLKRSAQHAAYAMCREARLTALEGEKLHLLFPPQCEFHFEGTRNKYRAALEEALAAVVGKKLSLVCQLEGRGGAAAPSGESAEQPQQETPAETAPPEDAPPKHAETAEAEEQEHPEASPRAPGEALNEAVSQTLDLFSGSQEIAEE
jgi:DNA polymerase III gamma/tau subunit